MPDASASPVALPAADELSTRFDRATWQRGRAYALDGRVLWTEVLPEAQAQAHQGQGPAFTLNGEVQGSQDETYTQQVTLRNPTGRHWVAYGRCSCPVARDCKHVVAVIVSALAGDWFDAPPVASAAPPEPDAAVVQPPPSARPPAPPRKPASNPAPTRPRSHPRLDRWLAAQEDQARQDARRASQVHTSLYRSAPADEHVHVVVLDVQAEEPESPCQWMTMWPGRARKLKSKGGKEGKGGGLGKVSQPSLHAGYGSPWDAHGHQSPLNDVLRHWYTGQQQASWRSTHRHVLAPHHAVRDELGAHALALAAQSGELVRLTPERSIGPRVSWGPPRPLQWAWVPEPQPLAAADGAADGEPAWRLRPDLGEPPAQLCLGEPLLYIDPVNHVVGRVDAPGMGVAEVRRWLTLPAMDGDWMTRHASRLRPLLPTLPEVVRSQLGREVRGVPPVACLRVVAHPLPRQALLQLHLSFDYDGVRGIWADTDAPLQQRHTPQGPVQLWRDTGAETAVKQALVDSGYMPVASDTHVHTALWQAHPGWADALPHARDAALLEGDFAAWRAAGWRFEVDAALQAAVHREGQLDMGLGELQDPGWFGLSMGFVVGHERINLLPLLPQLLRQWATWEMQAQTRDLPWPTHAWLSDEQGQPLRLPTAPLKPWLAALYELVGERPALQGEPLRLDRFEALRLSTSQPDAGGPAALHCSDATSRALQGLVQAMRQPDGVAPVALPTGLQATLRPYQRQGYSWLQSLGQHGLGGVLADDMGLGKTLQTIAHLLAEQQAGRLPQPALIVAPTSLVGNWRSELQRFAPGLRPLVLHGQDRHAHHGSLAAHDVVITTYPLLLRDEAVLTEQPWSVVVLDEAQAIKNARTRLATVVQGLQARQRLCLSGTPMENHLGEVWSLFHFLMPGYLGSEQRFKQVFRTPVEKHGDTERLALLRKRLQPFMLRRTKAAVAAELPPKVEAIEHIELAAEQANLYEVIRATTEAEVRHTLEAKGLARSHITVLDALLKLRQVCCDPKLLKLDAARQVHASAKMDWLVDNLPALIADGRRVLVFSAFSSMLGLIEAALRQHTDLKWAKLTGQSKDREAIVARFTSGEVPLFLISLKAGGVGLNLPQADTVVHVDPWWNPAAEDQATDRAHRMGQLNTVFVYKLVAQGTLEERIVAMQARKAALAAGLHGQAGAPASSLTESDLAWLLQPIGALPAPDKPAP